MKKISIILITVLVVSLFPSNLTNSIQAETNDGYLFDFGSADSPVADGYTQVANTLLYDEDRGYGLSVAVDNRDRGNPDDLRRDFVIGSDYSFILDIPNGDYFVRIIAGDDIAFNRSSFNINGEDYGSITSSAGEYAELTTDVTVTDEKLTIDIGENGRINGLEIVSMTQIDSLTVDSISFSADSEVALSWQSDPNASHYNIYRKGENDEDFEKIDETTEATYTDTTVELGYSYTYAVTLVHTSGIESDKSNEVSASIINEEVETAQAPSNLSVNNAELDNVTLSWDPVDQAILYYVYRANFNPQDYPEGAVEFEKVGTTSETSFTDDSILTYRNYYYQVRAVNEGGISASSNTIESPVTEVKKRQMEQLDRALVAVESDGGVYLGWKMLGTDPKDVKFNVYRDGKKINKKPIEDSTNYFDENGTADSTYQVKIMKGSGDKVTKEVNVWSENYLSIPLDKPEGGTTPDGVDYTYSANDASVGDLDGDGEYEIILKWDPSNSKDNSQSGYTGNVYLDAYKLDGTKLWRLDLGRNIRAGAHYTQFLVYDFDGNGKSEVVLKTGDGTIDGEGNVIGDPDADWRNSSGYILDGPEYLTVFEGETGKALTTTDYTPARGNLNDWGDNYGNRADRFLAAVAYLDGERPSFIMARGYYTRSVLVAYNWRDGELTQEWIFDSDGEGNQDYAGQGNHSLSVADVDQDGKDEIIYGAAVINDDGTGLYSTGWGHGDAQHVGDLNPNRPGLEIFQVHENASIPIGYGIRDAATGEKLFGVDINADVGRGLAADIDPRYDGAEFWSSSAWDGSAGNGLHAVDGELISENIPQSVNHAIWWDGDLGRELLDHTFDENNDPHGVGKIDKWDYENEELINLLTPEGTRSNNWTKGNPSLQADILGDWREEVIWPSADSEELRLYTTTDLTEEKIYTLMHDPVYRLSIAWQNVGYNQPPHTGFFLGYNMEEPPRPAIETGDKLFGPDKNSKKKN
ncbi:fibronectin type III domain-containing protein [Gracilibacillus sp. HCP3S3_G5_1]|uniref:rhamnogalacturonan lyase family protein n=1 Tax=unclassified Gracilibacillus TaxID=2625209 RepID=UPI003F8A3D6F